jgi:tRNA-splicing ligase RtcB
MNPIRPDTLYSDTGWAEAYRPEGGRVAMKSWTKGVEFEDEARKQVENIASLPFIFPHIAIMPDVHRGMGATVGSVIPTSGAVIPAAVGVDIGCGMMAVKLSGLTASQLPDDLSGLRAAIERVVPAGRTNDGGDGDRGAWHDVPGYHAGIWNRELADDYRLICEKHPKIAHRSAVNHLGTLGTGNHFLEICLEQNVVGDPGVWVVLHSGSRGVGNKFGQYFIEMAKEDMRKYFINLPDMDLAYLPEGTEGFIDYLAAVKWAQKFARLNRELMMMNAKIAIAEFFDLRGLHNVGAFAETAETAVNVHHNYLNWENHAGRNVIVTRKGAVRARLGDMGIIPGSMGARSYIVRGKGNKDALDSCSHGAGRRMSRTAAKNSVTLEAHQKSLEGVECDKSVGTIDETPSAYKDIDAVMEAQKDLVEIVHTLKQVLCVKGVSEESGWRKRKAEKKAKREAAGL